MQVKNQISFCNRLNQLLIADWLLQRVESKSRKSRVLLLENSAAVLLTTASRNERTGSTDSLVAGNER